MSLEVGEPAERGQAPSAEEPARTTDVPVDATPADEYGDSGVPVTNEAGVGAGRDEYAGAEEDEYGRSGVPVTDEVGPGGARGEYVGDEAGAGAARDEFAGPRDEYVGDEAGAGAARDEYGTTGQDSYAGSDVPVADEAGAPAGEAYAAPATAYDGSGVPVTDEAGVVEGGPGGYADAPGAADTAGAYGAGGAAAAYDAADAGGRPAAGAPLGGPADDLQGPLLGDVQGLRASWQQIQAGFVDNPQEALAEAANLIEQTVQALTSALQQRQQVLRGMWDTGGSAAGPTYAEDSAPTAAGGPGTEDLRLLMQRYRALFNEICGQ